MNKEKKGKDDWIRLASKSRPGRFYLFNKATGETQWLPLKQDEAEEKKKESAPKLSINKASKTPAQDRLKRLQHTLKLCQTKTHTSNTKPKILKKQNEFKYGPSTSSTTKTNTASPRKASKRSHGESFPTEKPESLKCVKTSQDDVLKKLPLPYSSSEDAKTSSTKGSDRVEVCVEDSNSSKELSTEDNFKVNDSKFANIRSGIFKKIKEICKLPFKSSKKATDDNLLSKSDNSFALLNTTKFKTTSRLKIQNTVTKQMRVDIKKSPDKIFTSSSIKNTNQSIPQYPRGSANSRLERLKQSLLLQQQTCSTKTRPSETNATETNNNKISSFQTDFNINSNESANISNNTADKTKNDDIEAMDWQPIAKEESPNENTNVEQTLAVEKSKKLLLRENTCDDNKTMGDIIDAVNENLLRFSAEKQKDSINNKKWRKDFYYFIVDTNVLLKDLTFIEDLTKMRLCDTKGSLLYIPYSVLQELDKLKMRSGCQEGVKTLSVRAIKYLNSKLENNSLHVQAQSAVEERQHLIDVNSADDSIINSCLQAKQHVPNLILLTEDVNLRNKAISNNIIVSTKSDLVAKRYDSSDVS